MSVSVIIPIKAKQQYVVEGFIDNIVNLARDVAHDEIQIVISDESVGDVYSYIDTYMVNYTNVVHFVPRVEARTGANDKSNGVCEAFKYAKYDNILLVDDHFRLNRETIIKLEKYFDKYDVFKCMPKFEKYKLSVLIDLCGMFVINILDYRKQYCGHLAFKKSQFEKCGLPCRDALFDEFAFEKHLRKNGYNVGFVRDVSIDAVQEITTKRFFEQRVRYAYENLAMPFRFLLYMLILPLLISCAIIDVKVAENLIIACTAGVTVIALIGQVLYGRDICPKYTFLLSPIWFWFYPVTTWMALVCFFNGGVSFGGNKVKKAG